MRVIHFLPNKTALVCPWLHIMPNLIETAQTFLSTSIKPAICICISEWACDCSGSREKLLWPDSNPSHPLSKKGTLTTPPLVRIPIALLFDFSSLHKTTWKQYK